MEDEGKVRQCKKKYFSQRSENNDSITVKVESENRILIECLEINSIEKSRLADEILI